MTLPPPNTIPVPQDFSELDLNSPIRSLVRWGLVSCRPTASLTEVFQAMVEARVGAIVVTLDDRGQGIFTQYDLLPRVLLPQLPLTTPISQVMTQPVQTISSDALVIDAMVAMAHFGVRHLPVVENGLWVGMLAERDLMAFHRTSLRSITAEIGHAQQLGELRSTAMRVREMVHRLLRQELSATSLAKLVSHLNDAMTRRVIALAEVEQTNKAEALPPWAWLALGSEGREEQTVATDQDNAIVFLGDGPTHRPSLMAFAQRVNRGLDEIGFPLCTGGVMAMNDKWCRSLDEWQAELGRWFSSPTPEHVLDSHTFLDFRPLYGEVALSDQLRHWIELEMPRHARFMRAVAEDALRSSVRQLPRLGGLTLLARWLRRQGLRVDWISPKEFDMKRWGTAPVVAWARALSQAVGSPALSTDGRLAALSQTHRLRAGEVQAFREAFDLVQRFRLRAQLSGSAGGNVLDLDSLSLHEVGRLTEALATLSRLRQSIALTFRL